MSISAARQHPKANKSKKRQKATGESAGIEPKHARIIAAVLAARSIDAGAKAAGISRQHFYRLMGDPLFRAEYQRQAREVAQAAGMELQAATAEAISTMRLLMHEAQAEPVRLRAAMAIVESNARFMEVHDLAERIAQMERATAQQQATDGESMPLWKLSDEQLHQLQDIQNTLAQDAGELEAGKRNARH